LSDAEYASRVAPSGSIVVGGIVEVELADVVVAAGGMVVGGRVRGMVVGGTVVGADAIEAATLGAGSLVTSNSEGLAAGSPAPQPASATQVAPTHVANARRTVTCLS
jgi:hypothetical protein